MIAFSKSTLRRRSEEYEEYRPWHVRACTFFQVFFLPFVYVFAFYFCRACSLLRYQTPWSRSSIQFTKKMARFVTETLAENSIGMKAF